MNDAESEKKNHSGDHGAAKTTEPQERLVVQASRLTAPLIYEVIRRDGLEEMARPSTSLVFSGLAAGILIAFSILGEAIFRAHLPVGANWTFLLENLGYSLGFLLVILGRMQLFTENTITTVLPLMAQPSKKFILLTARLWFIVLLANVVGSFIAAAFIEFSGAFPEEIHAAIHQLSVHATSGPALVAFSKAVPAGVLIAAIVWMMPAMPHNPVFIILIFTWLIAAGDFTHIIAGSVEMAYLVVGGEMTYYHAIFVFFIPVFFGNVIGGTAVFTVLSWAQVTVEVDDS